MGRLLKTACNSMSVIMSAAPQFAALCAKGGKIMQGITMEELNELISHCHDAEFEYKDSTSGEVNSKVGSAENNTSEEETIRVRSAKNGTSCKDVDAGRSAEIDTSRSSQIALQEVQESTLLEVQGSTPLKSNRAVSETL